MTDLALQKEQERVNGLVDKVELDSEDVRRRYKEAFDNYYKIQEDFSIQQAYKSEEENLKLQINNIKEVINRPYLGRIRTVAINGELESSYIGYKDYYIDNKRIIKSVWSTEGRAFSSKVMKYEYLNISFNRIVDIRESILQSYFDVIDRLGIELDVEINQEQITNQYVNSSKFSDLIEINKNRKDVLTTLSHIQNKIIDLPLDKNVIINGVPGSGKTVIGGYRLASLAYQYREQSSDFNTQNQFHYFTSSDGLKLYSLSFFSKIDLKGINFYSMDKMYDFNEITSDVNPNTTQVYNRRLDVKGKLVSKGEYYDKKISKCRVMVGKQQYEFEKTDLLIYKNNFTQLAKDLFGDNARKTKVDNFIGFRKSSEFLRAFQILNGKLFVQNYLLKLNQRFLMSLYDLRLKLYKDYNVKPSTKTCSY